MLFISALNVKFEGEEVLMIVMMMMLISTRQHHHGIGDYITVALRLSVSNYQSPSSFFSLPVVYWSVVFVVVFFLFLFATRFVS